MAFWKRKKLLPSEVVLDRLSRPTDSLSYKRAWEQQRVGVTGLLEQPQADRARLFRWSRQSEVAYSCIRVIVESAQDPDLIVQRRAERKAEWATEYGHPLRQLLMRPNPEMTQAEFLGVWLASEQICGLFCAEIERSKRGEPLALHPLDPTCMQRRDDGRWRWRSGGEEVVFEAQDLFVSWLPDPQCPWQPLAPLQVALGPIEADWMQNSFVRAFFKNGGVPSGIIKVKGVLAGEEGKKKAQQIKERWIENRGLLGRFFGAPEVFDDNASYEKVGSNLSELEGGTLRGQNEARICGVFGVPPLLVSAYVGLEFVNQRASAIESQRDFWANKMSPTFKRMRTKLQWSLLLEWEPETEVRGESVRLFWDMANVVALQESMSERDMRARESFRAGALRLDQYKAIVGLPIEAGDEYYLRRANQIPVTKEVIAAQMEAAAVVAARAISLVVSGESTPQVDAAQTDGKAAPGGDCGCQGKRREQRASQSQLDVATAQDLAAGHTELVLQGAHLTLVRQAQTLLSGLTPATWPTLTLSLPVETRLALTEAADAAFVRGILALQAERRMEGANLGFAPADVSRQGLDDLVTSYLALWLNQAQAEAVRLWGQPFYQQHPDQWREQLLKLLPAITAQWGAGIGRRAASLGRLAAQFTRPKPRKDDGEDPLDRCPKGGRYIVVGWLYTYRAGEHGSGNICPQCARWDNVAVEVMGAEQDITKVELPKPGDICYRPYACNCAWHDAPICQPI